MSRRKHGRAKASSRAASGARKRLEQAANSLDGAPNEVCGDKPVTEPERFAMVGHSASDLSTAPLLALWRECVTTYESIDVFRGRS
jgi:hypothetical protein